MQKNLCPGRTSELLFCLLLWSPDGGTGLTLPESAGHRGNDGAGCDLGEVNSAPASAFPPQNTSVSFSAQDSGVMGSV